MKRSLFVAFLLAACGASHAPATAAPDPERLEEAIDRSDGVGTFTSIPWGFDTNSFWIRGPTGVVVIDTQFLPSEARHLIDVVERRTGQPIVLAIVLHANPDKFNGADVFREHGIRVITSSEVLAHVPEIDAMRRAAFYERYRPDYPAAMPTMESFGSETTQIDAGGLALTLHVMGPGCSDAHVVVEWDGHVFVGDLVGSGVHSWLELGHVTEWEARIDEIAALHPRRVHPGRGASGGPGLLDAERAYLERVDAIVMAHHPTMPAPEGVLDLVRSEIEAAFPGYGYPVFLRIGVPAVWADAARRASP